MFLFSVLVTFFVIQGANSWSWNWNWNTPCRYLKRMDCDHPYYSLEEYYGRHDHDRDNDGDNDHDHDRDNDRYNPDRHGHGDGDNDRHSWYGNRKICGSDGVTYKNRCFYMKAHCESDIKMRHEGACTDSPKTTNRMPLKVTTPKSQPPVQDEFCKNLLTHACHGVNPICGTNNQSYDNECEFEKAKCLDGNVHVKHLGIC